MDDNNRQLIRRHLDKLTEVTKRIICIVENYEDKDNRDPTACDKKKEESSSKGPCISIQEQKNRGPKQCQKHKPVADSPVSPISPPIINKPGETASSTDGWGFPGFFNKSSPKQSKLQPYIEPTVFQLRSLEVKKATSFGCHAKLKVYNMRSRDRGVFFFVNIVNFHGKPKRAGAEKDRDNLVTLFREMNYTVFYFEDLTRSEFESLMNELVTSKHLQGIDSFVFCLLSHGNHIYNLTLMEFSDGLTASTEDVVRMFSNTSCQLLVHKPKIFFFPFCRGDFSDHEQRVQLPPKIETDGNTPMVPSFKDILICYATVPGFKTHRDVEFGSWYVKEMCKVFAEHACDSHIDDLLKMIGHQTMKYRELGYVQVASHESRGFNKLLYFNPKISS